MRYLSLVVLLVGCVLLLSPDALAQANEAENEIIRIVERVLDVVVRFFGALLDELARFVKEITPWGGSE